MKYLLLFSFLSSAACTFGQILDLELECPLIYAKDYLLTNEIHSISMVQTGTGSKKEMKKHMGAVITYCFDTTGIPYMKILNDQGDYTDTVMMNGARCAYKNDPDSRFYEENIFCNDKGFVIANQTERSRLFYRYDSTDHIRSWIQIDREVDEQSEVFYTRFTYDSIGRLDSVIEKQGILAFNVGIRELDTIYRTTFLKKVVYTGDRMSAVVTYTDNNLDQSVPISAYRYKYKGDRLDQVELYLRDDKKPIYTLKILKTE